MKQPSKQAPSTAPPGVDPPAPATVLDIKKNFKGFSVPTAKDFADLIDLCTLAAQYLDINSNPELNRGLEYTHNNTIFALKLAKDKGLELTGNGSENFGNPLQIKFGRGFKPAVKLEINVGNGIDNSNPDLALRLASDGGFKKDFTGFLAMPPLIFPKVGDEKSDSDVNETLGIALGAGLEFKENKIAVKIATKKSGLTFDDNIKNLKINYDSSLCLINGLLSVNIDNI